MNVTTDEWWVEVQGQNIMLALSLGNETDRWFLTRHQAGVLREQLRLAALLVGRNTVSSGGANEEAAAGAQVRDEVDVMAELDELLWDRLNVNRTDFMAVLRSMSAPSTGERADAMPGATESEHQSDIADSGLPTGWSVTRAGRTVNLSVPASGVDGTFELTDKEAFAAGMRLIQLSERGPVIRGALDTLAHLAGGAMDDGFNDEGDVE